MHEILAELKHLSNDLENVPYEKIYDLIRAIPDKCVPTAIIHKGWYIDRVRINDPAEVYFNKYDDVSHHRNPDLFHLIGRGRCNDIGQSIFYGSVVSPEIKIPRLVAYLETSRIQRDLEKFPNEQRNLNLQETFTMSRWRIQEDIEVVEMILSEEALKVSQYAKDALKNQLKNFGENKLKDYFIEQLKFFSDEFARNDIEKDENGSYQTYKYKISAAYLNYILEKTPFQGVTYPSVSTRYSGQNVALIPSAVEKYLKLESAGMFRFDRINGENIPIDCFKIATDLGPDQKAFVWEDYKS
ncbi:hypothetical protein [Mucilaginibacter sp.]|uniref:hypothetical protein n=1 Tax=Mucilaginibacter sp. TaxID=1882438 RepID=UPI0035BBB7AF